ncbi:hypothetical protein DPMN_036904 [Dreissena polymorpha]|uniref:Uncharacterized protein n=1 Tax=Dreissena polymorpha TaxID=45954 RepID=A0A9D4M9Y8_DREPO|nr:hypothetical protein DPMN_036904 [Dreissena polymorpha]
MALLSSPERRKLPLHPGGHFHNDWANNVTFKVHVIQLTELNSHINKTNVLTNFHYDWAKIKTAPPTGGHANNLTKFHENWANKLIEKCPAHWRPYINKTNVLTNFHDDWANIVISIVFTRKTAPPTGGDVFQRTGTTFEFNQHIIKANILINFELDHNIIGTNLLTKFHEDRKINVASRVFTNKCGRTDDRRTDGRTTDKDRSQKLT